MNNFFNHESEITLLGCILKQNDIMAEANSFLMPDDFSSKQNEIIFDEMLDMYKKRIGIDVVTLASHMTPEKLQSVGGMNYIMKAEGSPATILTFRTHINEIKKRSKI